MIQFTKLHGNGNDFILIDEYDGEIISEKNKASFAQKYCDRRFGIGADGVLYISKSDCADLKMRLLQPDMSEAEMCGNGIRCLVRYALAAGYMRVDTCTVETLAGVLSVDTRKENGTVWIKVNMGKPLEDRADIPAKGEGAFINEPMGELHVSVVNTGVPHSIVFVDDIDSVPLMNIAPSIRYDDVFPNGSNVNFVQVNTDSEVTIRTYERGVEGETLSCGTGSVAAAFIANKLGKTGEIVTVHTKGGPLRITIDDGTTYMEGQAEIVFDGTIHE